METNETLKIQCIPLMGRGVIREVMFHFPKSTIACIIIGQCKDQWRHIQELPIPIPITLPGICCGFSTIFVRNKDTLNLSQCFQHRVSDSKNICKFKISPKKVKLVQQGHQKRSHRNTGTRPSAILNGRGGGCVWRFQTKCCRAQGKTPADCPR